MHRRVLFVCSSDEALIKTKIQLASDHVIPFGDWQLAKTLTFSTSNSFSEKIREEMAEHCDYISINIIGSL